MRFLSAILLLAAGLLFALPAEARIWTLAKDPAKQFEGDLVKVDGENVTVKLANGKLITFKKSAVTEDDRKFIAEAPKPEEKDPKAESKDSKKDEKAPKAEEGKKEAPKPAEKPEKLKQT